MAVVRSVSRHGDSPVDHYDALVLQSQALFAMQRMIRGKADAPIRPQYAMPRQLCVVWGAAQRGHRDTRAARNTGLRRQLSIAHDTTGWDAPQRGMNPGVLLRHGHDQTSSTQACNKSGLPGDYS